jgi:hypothetical protein
MVYDNEFKGGGVLTGVKIDENTKGHESFIQIQSFRRIITLRHVFWYIMIYWFQYPYPSFYMSRGRIYKDDLS